ncbi:hypothetical protein TVAG_475120 [Trichomonas vaginalis G3]|uniref:Uncharacterized protein n=1 Tax=Trichomonas vaginalis (strain ATCC PRA-98 / G3) TaxID=412133 RepID=A2EM19_TRIV3|nr:hypothetical protein TVAGG3_0613350 [Trichomonas vaginalis G3]EAY06278.1 hypothetical protein TVAG_475120 [Trichomonas vaginalis G3]KAI5503356.1 hypothetical protein TVAGG3_0613350 [Trichomonas vaginalis G3]|eukprot:XP_001318501.1 hypothetical protein [Trichomonas vaginalis G3]
MLQELCLHSVVASGLPETYYFGLTSEICLSISIDSAPLYLSYHTPNTIQVTKYSQNQTRNSEFIIYQTTISNRGVIDFSVSKNDFYIFRGVGSACIEITMSSFRNFNCTDIFIENSLTAFHYYKLKSHDFFTTNITQNKCYLFSSTSPQLITLTVNACEFCPKISLYEGQYLKLVLAPDRIYKYSQQNDNAPLMLKFAPKNLSHQIDLPAISVTLQGNAASLFATNGSEFMRIHNFQSLERPIFYIYTYDIAAYALTTVFTMFSIAIIVISISIWRKKKMKIQAEEKLISITYPLTNVSYYIKNYHSFGID